jgi:hypothetical protein
MLLRWGRAGKRAFVLPLVVDEQGLAFGSPAACPTD